MSLTMGKGLSPLQKDILAILEEFPAREDFPKEGTISPNFLLAESITH
jgi:hypothetical protein